MERMDAEKDHLHKLVKRLELRLTDREKQAKSLEIASGDGHAASGDAYFIPNIREQHLEAEEDEEASIFARRADNDGEDESSSDTESTSHRQDNTPVANDGEEELSIDAADVDVDKQKGDGSRADDELQNELGEAGDDSP